MARDSSRGVWRPATSPSQRPCLSCGKLNAVAGCLSWWLSFPECRGVTCGCCANARLPSVLLSSEGKPPTTQCSETCGPFEVCRATARFAGQSYRSKGSRHLRVGRMQSRVRSRPSGVRPFPSSAECVCFWPSHQIWEHSLWYLEAMEKRVFCSVGACTMETCMSLTGSPKAAPCE